MERIEVSGVPVLIGTGDEHDGEVHSSSVCRTCDHSEMNARRDGLVCTIRLVVLASGRLHPMEVDENDTCDLHTDLQPDVGEDGGGADAE